MLKPLMFDPALVVGALQIAPLTHAQKTWMKIDTYYQRIFLASIFDTSSCMIQFEKLGQQKPLKEDVKPAGFLCKSTAVAQCSG